MSPTLFISDLHLCRSRPETCERFLRFLDRQATTAAALYILGDLFEYWAGDDDRDDAFNAAICSGLHRLAGRGVRIGFMPGNRDFLVGQDFTAVAGVELLPDPLLIPVAGVPTLLAHGDTLCTDDVAYAQFRSQVRSTAWQASFLALPLAQRKAQIEELRRRSEAEKGMKPMSIMDASPEAIAALLRQHGYPPRLIHGHTHRPACHQHCIDGHPCERWVLPAWDDAAGGLKVDADGCRAFSVA